MIRRKSVVVESCHPGRLEALRAVDRNVISPRRRARRGIATLHRVRQTEACLAQALGRSRMRQIA
ncbi:hypothetical protein IP86_15890 [Rhodopseudomonas sp. AAP120]|nr:hypothetical protein IP86_15890 [Rhodopseudomonas sp. AAP120]